MPTPGEPLRVLVVGAGLGTNAGLGLEVPLAHGKFLTDGAGGVVAVSQEERARRASCVSFPGFMGEEFWYLWERQEGYLGNGGFIYGALLQDPKLLVDMLQHPVTQADKDLVVSARGEEAAGLLAAEAAELRTGACVSYAAAIGVLLGTGRYDVVLAASKGISELLLTVRQGSRVPLVLLNGAEPPAAMDIGELKMGPHFGALGAEFLGCQARRLVLTSHGAEVSLHLRAKLREAAATAPGQQVLVYAALDHRCLPNRECHSLPWSLTFPKCWHSGFGKPPRLVSPSGATMEKAGDVPLVQLLCWAAGRVDHVALPPFPGPRRFAELRVEGTRPGDWGRLMLAPTLGVTWAAPRALHWGPKAEVYDILFDAQVMEMQVVVKHVQTGQQTSVADILAKEGQRATRLVRFFRYYQDKSAVIRGHLDTGSHGESDAMLMIHEMLAMNKNLGNFLWTGFVNPATATPRFGCDLLELVVEVELARLGGPYRGYRAALLEAEHCLQGQHSLLGCLDDFLARKCAELREQRRTRPGSAQEEEEYFKSHCVKELEGYVRRELTIDQNIPLGEVQQQIAALKEELGIAEVEKELGSSYGHSSNFRFFADGKAWLSAGCEEEDFDHVRRYVQNNLGSLDFLTEHQELTDAIARYQKIPEEIVPPQFFERNGYCVRAYRKFGAVAQQFSGGGWANFAVAPFRPKQVWVRGFGPAETKSEIFGHLQELPREIGRGGTTGRLYFYDVDLRSGSHATAPLYNAVQVNRASWWEPELYALLAQDLATDDEQCAVYETEADYLKTVLRTVFEQELAAAKNLWAAGIKKDGLRRGARDFPALGSLQSEDPELEELLRPVVLANVAMQEQKAAGSFSMGPTNAKRVASTGNFTPECRQDIYQYFLSSMDASDASLPLPCKRQMVTIMNRGLRSCPQLAWGQLGARQTLELRRQARRAAAEQLNSGGDLLGFRRRLAHRVASYNTFTSLQTEVNAMLAALACCT
ncbi:unnamed protein product [Effrenium voratum]|uniref:Uncharacterized protein n=1 Tax=Effrenium voratum TaxID=2562239 RepID=A0AA36JD94_9DINO|nr:unnamed protein product [Effrenium voratum]CAJ1426103.1 unnamed protein product [Effrenium voratum]